MWQATRGYLLDNAAFPQRPVDADVVFGIPQACKDTASKPTSDSFKFIRILQKGVALVSRVTRC